MRARKKAAGLRLVAMWAPAGSTQQRVYSPHRLLEARSLAMHAVIAEKIGRDPRLLEIARRNLLRWRAKWGREAPPWVDEWDRILERPWLEIAAIITEPSEEAARLRQSTPFAGVLAPSERKHIHDAFRA